MRIMQAMLAAGVLAAVATAARAGSVLDLASTTPIVTATVDSISYNATSHVLTVSGTDASWSTDTTDYIFDGATSNPYSLSVKLNWGTSTHGSAGNTSLGISGSYYDPNWDPSIPDSSAVFVNLANGTGTFDVKSYSVNSGYAVIGLRLSDPSGTFFGGQDVVTKVYFLDAANVPNWTSGFSYGVDANIKTDTFAVPAEGTPVPLPGAALMGLAGLAGLGVRTLRRRG